MKYTINIPSPESKYIDLEFHIAEISADKICLQLPAWRPGRYELGNFAKNIQRFAVFNSNGKPLPFKKVTKDKWEIDTKDNSVVVVKYNYFAAQLDAGGCWLDPTQLYINPVHCFMYVEGRRNESYEIKLNIPDHWKVAGSLLQKNGNVFSATDFDELADSPFIASATLKHHSYKAAGKTFHIWIQGECAPDFIRIEKDFKAFTNLQITTFNDIPTNEYHFLIQVLPHKFYHGVEHLNSTVLAIGPGTELMTAQYNELVGVASHELFHVWNIKTIRPVDMLPYDYTKENYSRLGFVYEGFTTYYGDLLLARTKFFSLTEYLDEFSSRLCKHLNNPGRFNYSVAQSSFDTWLDGYVTGAPGRKTSIYDEGSLIALMLDFQIRNATHSKKSLDDVLRILYNDFGKKKIGYTEKDIVSICESVAGISLQSFFYDYVYKAVSYEVMLSELVSLAGIEIIKSEVESSGERLFGFKCDEVDKVSAVAPHSPAQVAGILVNDQIISVKELKLSKDTNNGIDASEVLLEIMSGKQLKSVRLKATVNRFFTNYKFALKDNASTEQKAFLNNWLYY